jgi:hypothetical protein
MQKQSKLWSAFLVVSVFTFTAPAFVHSQSTKGAATATEDNMKSAERNSPCSSSEQHARGKMMHDSSSMKSTQKDQNPCDDPTNSQAHQRDMEQRFPHSNDAAADMPTRSKDTGS